MAGGREWGLLRPGLSPAPAANTACPLAHSAPAQEEVGGGSNMGGALSQPGSARAGAGTAAKPNKAICFDFVKGAWPCGAVRSAALRSAALRSAALRSAALRSAADHAWRACRRSLSHCVGLGCGRGRVRNPTTLLLEPWACWAVQCRSTCPQTQRTLTNLTHTPIHTRTHAHPHTRTHRRV